MIRLNEMIKAGRERMVVLLRPAGCYEIRLEI